MASTPPTPLDPQDPLPESNWRWRRAFTFGVTLFAFGIAIGLAFATNRIVGNIVMRIDNMNPQTVAQITVLALNVILRMFTLMFYTVMVISTYYMLGANMEQVTKLVQTSKLLSKGVQFATRSKVADAERSEEHASTAGLPPQPIAPPVSDTPVPTPEVTSDDEEDFAPRSNK